MRLLFAGLLTGCAGAPPPPPLPPVPPVTAMEEGSASFFFPLEIPLTEINRALEEALPRRMADERQQELTAGLQEDFYRYVIDRGPIETGFADGRITFDIPIHGSLTVGGRLRPVPLGRGLPVKETVEFSGWVRGTASPAVTPGWQPDPQPTAQLDLGRAELKILNVFSVRVVSFLETRLNPILNRELKQAATRLQDNLGLRRRAETAWRDLHGIRRAGRAGDNLWIRFQPTAISLTPIGETNGALRTGLGITGRIALTLGKAPAPPVPAPLPPLTLDAPRDGGFELEIPIAASGEDLARVATQALQGLRFRTSGTRQGRQGVLDAATLKAEAGHLILALDFHTEGRGSHRGRVILQGSPTFDPATKSLRLANLQYDLEKGDLGLRLLDRLNRDELRERLEKSARLDLTALLADAGKETADAIRDLFPPGFQGDVRVEPIQILGLGVTDGTVWARCRVVGTTTALTPVSR